MTTLLKNAWIYTPQGVIEGGYVVIDEAAIVSVGAERPEGRFDCEKDMSGKLLLPGLVNAHTHAAMTLLRGVGTDLPLQRWLFDSVFPVEGRMTAEDIRAGTALALLEMLACGTTSFSDMYFFPWEAAELVVLAALILMALTWVIFSVTFLVKQTHLQSGARKRAARRSRVEKTRSSAA